MHADLNGVVSALLLNMAGYWQATANYSSGIGRHLRFWGFHDNEN
jgi:hypothetical protein